MIDQRDFHHVARLRGKDNASSCGVLLSGFADVYSNRTNIGQTQQIKPAYPVRVDGNNYYQQSGV